MIRRPFSLLLAAAVTALTLTTAPVSAQNLFAPRIIVNGSAISEFELRQRIQMLRLFQFPGDVDKEARKALIEDRLRLAAAKAMNLTVTPEQIRDGMEEFAARANLTADQFIQALGQAGVSAETFRDFVEAGLLWRSVVREKYAGNVTISEAEIDRALANFDGNSDARVLISEIIISAEPGKEGAAMAEARRVRTLVRQESDFAGLAREYSTSATAGRGGRLDWMLASNLPPKIAPLILALSPGQVTAPVQLGETVGLFQLNAIEEAQSTRPKAVTVEYAQFLLPGGPDAAARAAAIRAKVDTCDDLYGVAKGLPADRLLRDNLPLSQVPNDIALRLANLDDNETTDFASRGLQVVLMLCGRSREGALPPSREEVRSQLLNRRVTNLAQRYLDEMRADAIITTQ